MKWIVESHTGSVWSLAKSGADHPCHYDTAEAARAAILKIFDWSIHQQESYSPIVRLRYMGD
jgi:hypothetical protein